MSGILFFIFASCHPLSYHCNSAFSFILFLSTGGKFPKLISVNNYTQNNTVAGNKTKISENLNFHGSYSSNMYIDFPIHGIATERILDPGVCQTSVTVPVATVPVLAMYLCITRHR